jgi:predicted nucleotidyltransferase
MATLTREEIVSALEQLGRLADQEGVEIQLVVIGGAAMVLTFGVRLSTRDVDVVIVAPREGAIVRRLARSVATERDWPEDWLNDAAKGYMVGLSDGPDLLSVPGLHVRTPSMAQL